MLEGLRGDEADRLGKLKLFAGQLLSIKADCGNNGRH